MSFCTPVEVSLCVSRMPAMRSRVLALEPRGERLRVEPRGRCGVSKTSTSRPYVRAMEMKRLPKTPTGHASTQVAAARTALATAASSPPVPELPSSTTSALRSEDRLHARRNAAEQVGEIGAAVIDHRSRHRGEHRFGNGDGTGNEEPLFFTASGKIRARRKRSPPETPKSHVMDRERIRLTALSSGGG